MQTNIALFSIKPAFAEGILARLKTHEFRRILPQASIDYILIYATAPVQTLVGYVKVGKIVKDIPANLWEAYQEKSGLSKKDFTNYFAGTKIGHAIEISQSTRFKNKVDPKKIWKKFHPPQSFMYISKEDLDRIIKLGGEDVVSVCGGSARSRQKQRV